MTPTKTSPNDQPPLVMATRCDATSSGSEQAFTIWANDKGDYLALCAHHANQYEVNLTVEGWACVEDRRHEVNSKPSPSASVLAETEETKGLDDLDD